MGIGIGFCCCGTECPPVSRPSLDLTVACDLSTTFIKVTLGTIRCFSGDFRSGDVYVADYESTSGGYHHFKRMLAGGRTINVEIDVSEAETDGISDDVTILVHDGTYGFKLVTAGDNLVSDESHGYIDCTCLSGIFLSIFYAARRFLPDNVPDTVDLSFSGESDGTMPCCHLSNGSWTCDLESTGDTVDGYIYQATWRAQPTDTCTDPRTGAIGGISSVGLAFTTTTSPSANIAAVGIQNFIGRPVDSLNQTGGVNAFFGCPNGRDVDSPFTVGDFTTATIIANDCSSTFDPPCDDWCDFTGTLSGISGA